MMSSESCMQIDPLPEAAKPAGPVGAALVAGGGIGGMQAALDLAEAGIKVYLVENSPAIGGTMAQLDKTFPTNDCAMCIMSPKLVEVGRHLNIEILTNTDVVELEGEPGRFTALLHQRPRYVSLDACTGCGDCAAACPVARPDEFNRGLSERKAIYKRYPQAIPNAFAIEKAGSAPCRSACPIHQRAQGYVALVSEGRFADAYRTILEENPFPSVCGRICNHRCEEACSRGKVDQSVNIMALKRFVSDWARAEGADGRAVRPASNAPETSGKRIAVVGAGPAGLTCALDLVRMGHQATVFEALPVAGGMMRVGIPAYRMPPEILDEEIRAICEEGVDLRLNQRVDDIPGLLQAGFDSVFVALGAHRGGRLSIPGADLPQVTTATDFLRQVSLGEGDPGSQVRGRRVVVLGGGNVAIDAAMTAVRLGAASVILTCLESRAQMPSHDWEIRDAEDEGIRVLPARTFRRILEEGGKVSGVDTADVVFRGFIDGRPDFDVLPGTDDVLPADTVIFAIGQTPVLEPLGDSLQTPRKRFVAVDEATLATSLPGVFAGGDVVTGTTFVVDAIAAGHRAARSIDAFLRGELATMHEELAGTIEFSVEEVQQRILAGCEDTVRREPKRRPAQERRQDFREVYAVLTEDEARAEAARCLGCGVCSECLQCVYACKAGAIDHCQQEVVRHVEVGAVVLAPGLEPAIAHIRPEYGYSRYPNVVTSIEFERMLSASGPFVGVVQRPSDGRHPVKVAWIQCVASRDDACGQGYCSSICCMAATKEAVIAREHDARIEASIFYIDMRAFGKGFDEYIEGAEREQGVRYVRSMVSAVREVPGTRDLRLHYATFDADGKPQRHEEVFDLVVLSVGLSPSAEARAAAERLGVRLNAYGFAQSPDFATATTSRPGVFVAGGFAEPKDIPETVIEASCAAARASELLALARNSLTIEPSYPQERDTAEEEARVGVFVCHCGINIGGVVNVPEVVEYAATLPGVAYAERNLYTCSQDTQQKITQTILEHKLNRVVVASCTPRTHEPLFQDTLRQAGLNPHLFEMANIREQDAWVHRAAPETATAKAKGLVRMAVAKAERLAAIQRGTMPVQPSALVIGGGLAGMTAALSIAAQGCETALVERQAELGGNLRHIHLGGNDGNPQALLAETVRRVKADPRITIYLESEIEDVSGYVGQFRTRLRRANSEMVDIEHGAIVVATGARQRTPEAYGYGQLDGVLTQRELELRLDGSTGETLPAVAEIVMIQCVGSRDESHPYCSRICCTEAIKNALAIKRRSPGSRVTILYRDVRSYGFREGLYRQARLAGVRFLPFDAARPPEVRQAQDRLEVRVVSPPERDARGLAADLVILSAGIEPEPGNVVLSRLLKLPLNKDGFFLEAHVKLRPVDFAAEGIFLCGMAHSPRSIDETIGQARAAAVRAIGILTKKELTATPIIASVNPRLCAGCGVCVEVCPFGARRLDPEKRLAEVVAVLCQGCGACVAACPNKASQQKGFDFQQVGAMLDAALLAEG